MLGMAIALNGLTPAPGRATDVIVYGDHTPVTFENGQPFQNPFTLQWSAGDPVTNLAYEVAPGLRNALGTMQWGDTAFGKYILSGTFGQYGVFPIVAVHVEDLLVNVFDTESKTACSLDVSGPGQTLSATTRTLVTANPTARQSRIFMGGQGYLGFIKADLDAADPCSWATVQITQTPIDDPDGIALLWHEDVVGDPFGRDFLVAPSWWYGTQTVYRVDSSGAQAIATYTLPMFARQGQCAPSDRPCYEITCDPNICVVPDQCEGRGWAVQLPEVDRSRGKNNVRWNSSLEMHFYKLPQMVDVCGGYVASQEYQIDLTAASPSIVPISPVFQAGALGDGADAGVYVRSDTHPTNLSYDSQGGMWRTLYRRITNAHLFGPYFYPTQSGVFAKKAAGQTCVVNQQSITVGAVGSPVLDGEHCYYDPAHANDMSRVNVDQALAHDDSVGGLAVTELQGSMYIAGAESIERASLAYGAWWLDSTYKAALPFNTLPAESRYCADNSGYCACPSGTPGNQSCADNAHCGAGVACVVRPETDFGDAGQKVLIIGGSPASLWAPSHYGPTGTSPARIPGNNLYWHRIPVVSSLPDGNSSIRPGLVWSGDRLWMVAEHGGTLKYRVRDDGIWSGWYSLSTNIAVAGGAALTSDGSTVELFARGAADGKIYTSALSSSVGCTPGTCIWTGWQAISGGMTTDVDPAVAMGGSDLMLVVRDATGGVARRRLRSAGTWGSWKPIGGQALNAAMSIAWNSVLGEFWVVARDPSTGTIRWTSFTPEGSPAAWQDISPATSVLPWNIAPSIAFDGTAMHVFTAASAYPQYVYQSVAGSNGVWGAWTRPISAPISTRQVGAAVVNGDVNVVTNWLNYQGEVLAK